MTDGYQKHREILRLYDEEGLTFSEIGEILKTSKQRVHQIYQDAKLKHRATMCPLPMRPTPRHFKEKAYDWEKIKRDIEVALKGESYECSR